MSPEENSTPTKPGTAGIVDLAMTVVYAVLVVVVKKTLVLVTLLVVVYVDVVENVLVMVDGVVVTVCVVVVVVVVVVLVGVMVVSGVEAERTIITSVSICVDDVVGIGVLAEVLVSFVTHCTVCDVDELTVAVKVSPVMMESAKAKRRNSCNSIMREL